MVHTGEYKLISVKKETPDTVSFVLSGPSLEHQAGQFVMIDFLIDEKVVKRAYSIASSPKRGQKGEIELCVKAMSNGLVSKQLQDAKISDVFKVSGPFGRFVFDPDQQKDIVMLGAGSGIAPFVSMIEEIKDENLDNKACLIFSNKIEEDIIYRKKLDDLASDNENIEIHYTLTRYPKENIEGEDLWLGKTGRIDSTMLKHLCGEDLEGKDFFICGPNVFAKSMKELLLEKGVKLEKIHFESYG